MTSRILFSQKYHDNCHDFLKKTYLEKYANQKYKNFLYDIKNKIPVVNICHELHTDQYSKTIICDQHAVIFGHKADINPILATYALNACVGLVLYSAKYGVGALAHIDGLPGYTQKSALEDNISINFSPVEKNIQLILTNLEMIAKHKSDKKFELDFYLVGGIYGLSEVMIHDIIETLLRLQDSGNYIFNFRGRNILGPENQSRNICIDIRTGEVLHFDYVTNSEFYDGNKNTDNLPFNIVPAPRKSEAFLDVTYKPIIIN